MRARVLLLVGVLLAPPAAFAGWTDFLPRSSRNGAFVELYGSYERDHGGASVRRFLWTDSFFREKLTLYSSGYLYHPKFLQYHLSLTGALKQEDYAQSSLPALGWKQATGLEYEGRLYLLPEHPYNLQLFARRYEPLLRERTASQHDSVQTSRGASLRYRKKPYFVHARYVDDRIESGSSSSEVERLGVDGQYFKRHKSGAQFSLVGDLSPSRFNNSFGLRGDTLESLVGGTLSTRRLRVTGNLTRNVFDQERDGSLDYRNRQLGGYGLATAYLPWSFRTDLTYRRVDNETRVPASAGVPARKLSNLGNDVQFDLVHRLYQNLDSTYTFFDTRRTSAGGSSAARSHGLNFSYTKKIPRGRLLAGINTSRGDTTNAGRADVASEPHPGVLVPGAFSLLQRDVDPASLVVLLTSPLPPFENVPLVANLHYVVAPLGNALQVNLLTLPAEFVVPGSYDLLVSYSLLRGDFGLRTESFGSNLSVELFDTLLTPYASYTQVRSDVTAGVFPGDPLDSTTYTTGLLFHKGRLRARGEYQRIDWDVSPSRAWRAELRYVGALNPTTSVHAATSYVDRQYLQGAASRRPAYDHQTANASGNIRKHFFARQLTASVGATYSRLRGLSEGRAYSLNGALIWRVGQLMVEAGATAYSARARTTGVPTTDRDHQYYYLKLRRNFF